MHKSTKKGATINRSSFCILSVGVAGFEPAALPIIQNRDALTELQHTPNFLTVYKLFFYPR